ncbi:hypothetical protein [Wolbachia endosymbiont (group A) of Sicus ferrugineus]|uniref:hypothetical protein n=1 Tax=Wolbachia endosymbiont (group A) of Sicus ferrugineus TaxID=2954056 RepID=UPI00222F2AF0|nr:hypothetical protein [Wolbachia endosymbiont (group A) of Sicus ferrugineus]
MLGSANTDKGKVTLTSHTPIDENGGITPEIPPTPAPRNTEQKTDETPLPVPPKNRALQLDMPQMLGLEKSPGNELEESPYAELNLPPSEGSVHGESERTPYTDIGFSNEASKESLDSGISYGMKRSVSQETEFSNPWDSDKTLENLKEEFSTQYSTGEMNSKTSLINSQKKVNRIWPRAKYAMQQKGFVIFGASAIILSTSAALVYLQDKAKFIAFFTNSPKYITIPVIALAALLAISPIFFAIKQFRNTEEHHIQKEDANEILADVLEHQPKNKAIKSVRLEYSNGTHSNFVLNAWEAKNNFINIDEKVVGRTNKIESVINNRPLFTALLTGVVAANIALPLLLYAEGGVNNIQKFYQNPLINNIGLSLLIGSGILALSIICLGVHYYRKTNCTNLIYSQEKINTESVNKKFIEEIKQERTEVLGENHSKDAKRSSLTLEQVVVQSHNCKDVVYSVG